MNPTPSTASAGHSAGDPATRVGSTVLGYPRIGPSRELKFALEGYWSGRHDADHLRTVAAGLRASTWRDLAGAGLDSVPGNTFSYYDHVLDAAVMVDAVPDRYRAAGSSELDTYFAMARGTPDLPPLEMTKWFDTNYHYLVPELGPDSRFRLADRKPVEEFLEAKALGVSTRPVVLGPVTFLLLSKADESAPGGFSPLDLLDALLPAYADLLAELHDAGAAWVQLDEPAFAADRSPRELGALQRAYAELGAVERRPRLMAAGYFGDFGPALPILADSTVDAIAVDLVRGPDALTTLSGLTGLRTKTVVAGLVDGRNIWRTDLDRALGTAATLLGLANDVAVSTSCSLLHVPYELGDAEAAGDAAEPGIPARVRGWLAGARRKVDEVVVLGRALDDGRDAVAAELAAARTAIADRAAATEYRDDRVRGRLSALRPEQLRRGDYEHRATLQQDSLGLPPLPTTTIGSFPQTPEIRSARAQLTSGRIGEQAYGDLMRAEIERVIRLQEELGLDVLVHGEPERNDMVQYFAEQLAGFASTRQAWVQSYGSRCVRPPILYGDVARPQPMTLEWTTYAQSLTDRPVKGMLTGPVTILGWSFVRDDQPLADTARQVALAIRDEVHDLEAAGIRVVQVDEPALRELLPLRERDHKSYLDWAVESFRLATAGAADSTQIHTHMCYSEFGDILPAIDAIDADVTSIEAARSRMEVLDDLAGAGFDRGVGPGVYDIHSPRVPETADMERLLRAALDSVPAGRLWANPDCGLKTRGYAEVTDALRNLVAAAVHVRADSAAG